MGPCALAAHTPAPMSLLAVLIPARPRQPEADAAPPGGEWAWVLSVDGRSVARQGRGAPADWPPADELVAVLAEADVAWLPATLPKAPASRLPQALLGLLEDQLLDDDVHFALAPGASAGQPTWVAVVDRPWFSAALQWLDSAGRPASRAVPLLQPGTTPARGHFVPGGDDAERLQLAWSDERGAGWLGVDGSLARQLAATAGAHWTAAPACAGAAEAWLGHPVAALGDGERVLQAAASGWNLRQFGLAPRHRGAGRLKDGWRRFLMPAWRPVHWGLLGLVAVNLVGLNAWAWQQQRALDERRQAMVTLLREAHPQVRAVLDPPLQMKRETDRLRVAAGQPGDDDLETLLGVAAAVWPEDEPPVAALQFEPGRLVLDVEGWDAERLTALREQLAPAGWQALADGPRLTLRRTPEGAAR